MLADEPSGLAYEDALLITLQEKISDAYLATDSLHVQCCSLSIIHPHWSTLHINRGQVCRNEVLYICLRAIQKCTDSNFAKKRN
jgi:hypothetical protein